MFYFACFNYHFNECAELLLFTMPYAAIYLLVGERPSDTALDKDENIPTGFSRCWLLCCILVGVLIRSMSLSDELPKAPAKYDGDSLP